MTAASAACGSEALWWTNGSCVICAGFLLCCYGGPPFGGETEHVEVSFLFYFLERAGHHGGEG